MKSIGLNTLKLFLSDEELAYLELVGDSNNSYRVARELNIPANYDE